MLKLNSLGSSPNLASYRKIPLTCHSRTMSGPKSGYYRNPKHKSLEKSWIPVQSYALHMCSYQHKWVQANRGISLPRKCYQNIQTNGDGSWGSPIPSFFLKIFLFERQSYKRRRGFATAGLFSKWT